MKKSSIGEHIKRDRYNKNKENLVFLLESDAVNILEAFNIPYPPHGLAHNPEEAVQIAQQIGYPVVLKVVSPDVIHKSDIGGVVLGNKNADEVHQRFSEISDRIREKRSGVTMEGILVCQQARKGMEVIIGAVDDPTFGTTIMFGLGGIYAETLDDVSFRVAPLERRDAMEMIGETKGYPLLTGARGREAIDEHKLEELIMDVSRLVTEHQEIKQLDLNPVRLYPEGLLVLDVRMLCAFQAA